MYAGKFNMKIAVIGLGIIGASIARSLQRGGYSCDGWNRSKETLSIALENSYIDNEVTDISAYDVVFVALPPIASMEYIEESEFKKNAIIADICGVKGVMENFIYSKTRDFRYVGTHPMAGKETRGIFSSSSELFKGASMIITENEKTDKSAVEVIKTLSKAMGFSKIVQCSAEYHDKKIALTSQLAHIVSNAYVKSPTVEGYQGFTGGSFQDMTRVAGVDENVWTQLYLMNRVNLLEEVDTLIKHLKVYRDALENSDEKALSEALKEGRIIREDIKNVKNKK